MNITAMIEIQQLLARYSDAVWQQGGDTFVSVCPTTYNVVIEAGEGSDKG